MFLSYDEVQSPELVGNKFFFLSQLSQIPLGINVPKAICITTDVFHQILGPERIKWLQHFFEDLRATVGCFLVDTIKELENMIQQISLDELFRLQLEDKMKSVFGEDCFRKSYAVRSSCVSEDSINNSYAGVYHSDLNVTGIEKICRSILVIMKDYYSYSSVASRIRSNHYDYLPDMGIIIQEMVISVYAGVAFTYPENNCMLEYVEGLGDKLVSGHVKPVRYSTESTYHYDRTSNTINDEVLNYVIKSVLYLKEVFGYSIDVEWALDNNGDLYLLQMRPITKELVEVQNEPIFITSSLYSEELPSNLKLGECARVYASYVKKRAPTYQLAEKLGCKTGKGYVVHFNGKGLLTSKADMDKLLNRFDSTNFVLDINDNIRQVILTADEIYPYLEDTYALNSNSMEGHTIIIREFIKGEFGFISKCYEHIGMLIEYSFDGLLAINRGMADCHRVYFDELNSIKSYGDSDELESLSRNCESIKKLTEEMNRTYDGCQLEWVMYQGVPYYVDFSYESSIIASLQQNEENLTIVSGTVRAPALNLIHEKEILSRLSVGPAVSINKTEDLTYHSELKRIFTILDTFENKPIIVVDKPYAVLSIFFDRVAGFIFKEGSLLCHLSILLRENNITSLICPNFSVPTGTELLISDHQLVLLSNTEESGGNL